MCIMNAYATTAPHTQHDVDVDGKGLPPILRCTGQKLQDSGVYVVGMMS